MPCKDEDIKPGVVLRWDKGSKNTVLPPYQDLRFKILKRFNKCGGGGESIEYIYIDVPGYRTTTVRTWKYKRQIIKHASLVVSEALREVLVKDKIFLI